MSSLILGFIFGIPASLFVLSFVSGFIRNRQLVGITEREWLQSDPGGAIPRIAAVLVCTWILGASLALSGVLVHQILYGRDDLLLVSFFPIVFFGIVYYVFAASNGKAEGTLIKINHREVHPLTHERFYATVKAGGTWTLLLAAAVPWGVLLAHFLLLGALGGLTDAPAGLVPECARYDDCTSDPYTGRRPGPG